MFSLYLRAKLLKEDTAKCVVAADNYSLVAGVVEADLEYTLEEGINLDIGDDEPSKCPRRS